MSGALVELDNARMVGGVPAVIAAACVGVHTRILWEGPQRLLYRGLSAPQIFEARPRRPDPGGDGLRRIDRRAKQRGAVLLEILPIQLIVGQQIRLETAAQDTVIGNLHHRGAGELALNGDVEGGESRWAGCLTALPPGHRILQRKAGVDERRLVVRRHAVLHAEGRLDAVAVVRERGCGRESALVRGAGYGGDGAVGDAGRRADYSL